MSKRSSKLLVFDSRGRLYCVYRDFGAKTNPNSISLIGTDGDTVQGLIAQVSEKFNLDTAPSDWSLLEAILNPKNDEVNLVWKYGGTLDRLYFLPQAYGGLMCLVPSALWGFEKSSMLSPAARSIMLAMPNLFPRP